MRRALGAQSRDLLWLVARCGGTPLLAGLAAGFCFTLGFTRILQSLLYGVEPADPNALMLVSLLLAVSAAVAMSVPARRAARIDPMAALHEE